MTRPSTLTRAAKYCRALREQPYSPRYMSRDSARILIVDQDMHSADRIEHMLRAMGYAEIRVAYSGEAALAVAAAWSRQLRLIALTFSREHAERDLDRSAAFERYLLKPIGLPGLSELLEMQAR